MPSDGDAAVDPRIRTPIGRRQAIGLLGAATVGAVVLGACSDDSDDADQRPAGGGTAPPGATATSPSEFEGAATCAVTPEQAEGPYYIDVDKIRGDIREDREGVELRVAARVVDADGCTPIRDAVFEIWHADAHGEYSDFDGGGGGTTGSRYLRGAQVTNADGVAEITTIYPGWYPGRTPHIHAKVFISNAEVLVTQFYFDDGVSNEVYERAPYSRRGKRDRSNSDDRIFSRRTVLTTSRQGDAYRGLITIGVER